MSLTTLWLLYPSRTQTYRFTQAIDLFGLELFTLTGAKPPGQTDTAVAGTFESTDGETEGLRFFAGSVETVVHCHIQ